MKNSDYKSGKLFYDLDNKKLYFSDECKKYFDELKPLTSEINNILTKCDRKEFIRGTLKYKDEYINQLNLIFDKNKYIFELENGIHSNLYFTFLYYAYWLSRI